MNSGGFFSSEGQNYIHMTGPFMFVEKAVECYYIMWYNFAIHYI